VFGLIFVVDSPEKVALIDECVNTILSSKEFAVVQVLKVDPYYLFHRRK
jgi:hypothetical protein